MRQRCTEPATEARAGSPPPATVSPWPSVTRRPSADAGWCHPHRAHFLDRKGAAMLSSVRQLVVAILVSAAGVSAHTVRAQSADVSLMFRGAPAHTGVAAAPLFDGQGGVKWRFETRGAVRSTPAVTATRVFIGSGDSTLYALD